MGHSNKRRHEALSPGDVSCKASSSQFAIAETLSRISPVKKPRLSADAPALMVNTGDLTTTAEDDNDAEDVVKRPAHASKEWQVVGRKPKRKSRRRAGDEAEKTKYPELTFHSTTTSVRLADLQNLVLYTLADGVAPNWLAFKHAHHTRKVVVLMVPGLELGMFNGSLSFDASNGAEHKSWEQDGERKSETAPLKEQKSVPSNTDREDQNRENFNAWKSGNEPTIVERRPGAPLPLSFPDLNPSLQETAKMFNEVWPIKAPGDTKFSRLHSPIQAILIAPIPTSKGDKHGKGPRPPAEERSFRPFRTPITTFVHSVEELREADYPVHPAAFNSTVDAALEAERRRRTELDDQHGWVDANIRNSIPELPSVAKIEKGSITCNLSIYSVDCEMVLTEDDVYSLARISILDWSGRTVLDKYVKPSLPIKNYFTQFSGVTPEILEEVTTTLSDIQRELLQLFTPSTILLGHSLESDLNALKMTHPFIVDTSLIYPHPRGPPLRSSLKFLTQKYLHKEIQKGGDKGHNSVEDALAVLDLVKLKCEKGPTWGTSEASGEPIFRRLGRAKGRDNEPRTSAIVDYGTPERGYGKEATNALGCSNDDEIVSGICRAVNGDACGLEVRGGGVDFTWGRLRELESFRGWCNNNREYGVVDPLHSRPGSAEARTLAPTTASEHDPADQASAPSVQYVDGNGATNDSAVDAAAAPVNPDPAAIPPSAETLASMVLRTISRIKTIHDALPPCTLFIVYSGTGDPREVGRLQKMQTQYRKEFKTKKWDDLTVKWTDKEEQDLRRAVEVARAGCGFLCIT